MKITFEQLPEVVASLFGKVEGIERLLLSQNSSAIAEPEKPLTVDEAGEFLSLAVPTVYSLVQRREIPFSRRGKRLYFSKSELIEWVQAGRIKTTKELVTEAESELVAAGRGRR